MPIDANAERRTLAIEDPNAGADLPERAQTEALKVETSPTKAALFGNDGWLGDDSELLDSDAAARDYGGYRPAVGAFADPEVRHNHETSETADAIVPGLDAQTERWDEENRP